MAIQIPHRRMQPQPPRPPDIDPIYGLIAATQMHSEGRLYASDPPTATGAVTDKLSSIPTTMQPKL